MAMVIACLHGWVAGTVAGSRHDCRAASDCLVGQASAAYPVEAFLCFRCLVGQVVAVYHVQTSVRLHRLVGQAVAVYHL